MEKLIEECINSLLRQTIGQEHLELIFVDDASTDGTYQILQDYAKRNSQCMKIFRLPENGRQGAARNLGMSMATGNYIGFVDADDYVEADMYEALYHTIQKTEADVAVCGCQEEFPDGKKEYLGPKESGVLDLETIMYKNMELGETAPSGMVQRLYKKEFLNRIKLKFPEHITYEDNYFDMISNYYLKKAGLINQPLYHYRINNNSTVQKKDSLHHLDRLKSATMMVEELKRRNLFSQNKEEIEVFFMELYFVNTILTLYNRFEDVPEGIIKEMQKTVKANFPDWRNNRLLQNYRRGGVRRVCELVDYRFEKGNRQELDKALKSIGILK